MTIFSLTPNQIAALLLIFVRIGGIVMTAPVFSSYRVPLYLRAGISFLLAVILQPMAAPQGIPIGETDILFGLLVIKETLVGVVIGYTANMIFSAVQMAGEIQDTQAGYGFAGVVDPNVNRSSAILGQFQMVLMWVVFLVINGHHVLLASMMESFSIIPVGTFAYHGDVTQHFFSLTMTLMFIAIKIGAPIIGAMLLTDLALGMLQRTAPQLNLIAVGFQIKTAIAITVMLLTLPYLITMQRGLVDYMGSMVHDILQFGR